MDRYVTILKQNTDGIAEVIDAALMEGAPKEINVDAVSRYEVRQSENLRIGMISGGPVNSVEGYGFALGTVPTSDIGTTRIADTKPDEAALPAVSHEKQRGTAPQANPNKSDPYLALNPGAADRQPLAKPAVSQPQSDAAIKAENKDVDRKLGGHKSAMTRPAVRNTTSRTATAKGKSKRPF